MTFILTRLLDVKHMPSLVTPANVGNRWLDQLREDPGVVSTVRRSYSAREMLRGVVVVVIDDDVNNNDDGATTTS